MIRTPWACAARISLLVFLGLTGCAGIPEPKIEYHQWPVKTAFIKKPDREYEVIGIVRAKVDYPTMTQALSEQKLCENYFNKAAKQLVKLAKEKGGDAVVDVRSVVFLMDGKSEVHETAECVDDGDGGQVLAQGQAVKWKPLPPALTVE